MNTSVKLPGPGTKVFVGLSGGVDSAVTAALLSQSGADVTGVFIKGWYPPGMPCTWSEDRRDAMRVAAHLRLPFSTLDASEEYRKGVIEYLLREYKAGRTPNPDVMCNREVKFGAFHAYAKEQGADYIATGHYAQVEHTSDHSSLMRGVDPDKDQSYFLWAVPTEALTSTLFPLGHMHKPEVRAIAQKLKLPNARKRDSQGICFLGNISVEDFLAQEFGTEKGVAIDSTGTQVGIHQGVLLSTLGQRVSLEDATPGPWFVAAKDIETNTLIVSHEKVADSRTTFRLEDANWFESIHPETLYSAQYRYHGPQIPGTLSKDGKTFTPSSPVAEVVAAGQSLVLYNGDTCVGGGIIA
jgi:tRNA-uridine 2-sulfurtransferase